MDLNDDIEWASRSRMWQGRVEKASARRTKRAKPAPALTLAGHGVSLRIENGALTIQMDLRTIRSNGKYSDIFGATWHCPSASSFWTGAAAFHLTSYHGSPSRKSVLFELIGKATLLHCWRVGIFSQSASRALAIGKPRKSGEKK
jgi:hypothetical protein